MTAISPSQMRTTSTTSATEARATTAQATSATAVEEELQEPPVDAERLAVYEAMAAQEARLVAQAERITALEAALKAKGGEGK